MTRGSWSRVGLLLIVAALAATGEMGLGQSAPDPGDLRSIPDSQGTVEQLVQSLQSHTLTPAQALDPTLDQRAREGQLRRFRNGNFRLEIEPSTSVSTGSDGFASMQASFRLYDGMATRMRTDATLQFVQRGDRWYFANYNFLDVSGFLLRVLVGLVVIAGLLGWLGWLLLKRLRVPAVPMPVSVAAAEGHYDTDFGPPRPVPAESGEGAAWVAEPSSGQGGPGWTPELAPGRMQTSAYPVAPPHYEEGMAAAPVVEQTTAYSVAPPQYEAAPATGAPQTTAYPVAPPRYETVPGARQTTAYPVAPPRYDAEADALEAAEGRAEDRDAGRAKKDVNG